MRISIVTITYNAASTLRPTLDSVAMQEHDDVEHIIVDGASTDATADIARQYAEAEAQSDNGHEVIVMSEPDHGLYDAMNKGLRLVTGDYVCFLNAGDRLPENTTLTKVAEVAELGGDGNRPGVVYGDTDLIDAEGRFVGHRHHAAPESLSWRSFRKGMLVCHQAFYARLDIAQRFPYDLKYRHSADVDWCIRIMKEAARLELPLVNTHAVVADFEEGGDTTQNHRASLLERYNIMATHYGRVQTFLLHCWFAVRALFRGL